MRGLALFLFACGVIAISEAQAQTDLTPATAVMKLEIRDARADETAAGGSSTVSMLLTNPTDITLELVGASTPLASQTLLQRYGTTREGLLQVVPQPKLLIPARGEVVMAPGALEIQLIGAITEFKQGLELPLTLKFADGTTRVLRVTIQGDR
ncbi:MAG: hypothetical protein DI585_06680 [Pseudomonas fluorescens]|nr:MAG: hypothetical protein DI585_06680 [Pseudomonas fluorescens]